MLSVKRESRSKRSASPDAVNSSMSSNLSDQISLALDSPTVSLADQFLGDEGIKLLVAKLKADSGAEELDLRGNHIKEEGIIALADTLPGLAKLKRYETCRYFLVYLKRACRLSLEWNSIGMFARGATKFAECLADQTSIVELDLRNNRLSSDFAMVLAESLRKNSVLQVLGKSATGYCAAWDTLERQCFDRLEVERNPHRWCGGNCSGVDGEYHFDNLPFERQPGVGVLLGGHW